MDENEAAIEEATAALKYFNRAEIYYQLSHAYLTIGNINLGKNALIKALELNAHIRDEYFEKYPILKQYAINTK